MSLPTIDGKPIHQLSDRELEREVEARRRARRRGGKSAGSQSARRPAPPAEQVRKYLANLELEPGATKAEIDDRYLDLLDRYDPDRQSDPAKKKVAEELTAKLRDAYDGLKAYFASR